MHWFGISCWNLQRIELTSFQPTLFYIVIQFYCFMPLFQLLHNFLFIVIQTHVTPLVFFRFILDFMAPTHLPFIYLFTLFFFNRLKLPFYWIEKNKQKSYIIYYHVNKWGGFPAHWWGWGWDLHRHLLDTREHSRLPFTISYLISSNY